jgi:hypothetical protein
MVESTTAFCGGLRSERDRSALFGFQFVKRRAWEREPHYRIDDGTPLRLFTIRRPARDGIRHHSLHMCAGRRKLMAHGCPDLIQLLAQNLAALIGPQPTHSLRTISVAQIAESTNYQLSRDALPKVCASPYLERDRKFFQHGLQRQTDGTGPVQNSDLLRSAATLN